MNQGTYGITTHTRFEFKGSNPPIRQSMEKKKWWYGENLIKSGDQKEKTRRKTEQRIQNTLNFGGYKLHSEIQWWIFHNSISQERVVWIEKYTDIKEMGKNESSPRERNYDEEQAEIRVNIIMQNHGQARKKNGEKGNNTVWSNNLLRIQLKKIR